MAFLVLEICNVRQILTMIARITLQESYLVCSDINERYDFRQASFSSVFEVLYITSNLGVSSFSYRIFLKFESSQLS